MWKSNKKALDRKRNFELLLMCIPTIIKLFIFSYIPMVGIIMAFQFYIPSEGLFSEFIGWENFEYLFASLDAMMIFKNTILYNILFIITGLIVAVLLALFMFEMRSKVFLKATQTMMFFPYFSSWVLAGTLVMSIIGSQGLFTTAWENLTGTHIGFYENPKYWYGIMVCVNIWKGAGVSAIIYYATLLNIDKEIFEAAEVDGAGVFRKMFYISIPQIKTMVIVTTIMSCSNILRSDFGLFYYVARGPLPAITSSTEVIDTYIYKSLTTGRGSYGVGTAVSLMQGVVGLILTFFMNLLAKKVDPTASLF